MSALGLVRTWWQNQQHPLARARRAFTGQRLDYYAHLADLLEDTDGRTNLLRIFERDALRHGGTPRGQLSAHWAEKYESSGASLSATWQHTLPAQEVMLIAIAEQAGAQALVGALRDLERIGRVLESSRRAFAHTVLTAVVACAISGTMLLAVPYFFVPFLDTAFGFVPGEYRGAATRAYYGLANFLRWIWPLLFTAMVGAMAWLAWALPRWTGPVRSRADEALLLFRLYRDFKGALFLAMLASLTQNRGGATTSQREALLRMQVGAPPWLAWKIRSILENIDNFGGLDARMLDVGLVDPSVYHLFADVLDARGLSTGLQLAGRRSEQRASVEIARRAQVLRWALLGGAVALMVLLVVWLDVVVYEFKSSMVAFTQSR